MSSNVATRAILITSADTADVPTPRIILPRRRGASSKGLEGEKGGGGGEGRRGGGRSACNHYFNFTEPIWKLNGLFAFLIYKNKPMVWIIA